MLRIPNGGRIILHHLTHPPQWYTKLTLTTNWQRRASSTLFTSRLRDIDPEVSKIIACETQRQRESLVLIPSENFTSRAVLEALGSVMQNKYSEGYPGARYYGGNEFIDSAERLCQQRALEAFGLPKEAWGVNVQPLSGSPANFYVYTALLKPHSRILGLDLPDGGHLSHGYQTLNKKISAVSTYFETFGYRVDPNTGLIDYEKLEELAKVIRPRLLIAGASAYPRKIDFGRMKKISESVNAYLMADISHWSGLMAAGVVPNPFPFADVVTTTTHKTLRGPRGAMIFYRQNAKLLYPMAGGEETIGDSINQAVFPGHQGGPHNHTITALAVALEQTKSREFKEYQQQVLTNCQALATRLSQHGIKLVSGGTDTHLLLLNLMGTGADGAKVERVLELANVAANKNTIPGDQSALRPSGLRIGTPAMTCRGFTEGDFLWTADIINEAIKLSASIEQQLGTKSFTEFRRKVTVDAFPIINDLQKKVKDYVSSFPLYIDGDN